MTSTDVTFPLAPRRRFAGLPFGGMNSVRRGSGSDIAGSRPYRPGDDARSIDWNASARLSSAHGADEFIVREYIAEEAPRVAANRFERAVTLCAGIAWHFFERNAQLQFRSAGMETPLAPAEQTIFAILRHLATAQPLPPDPDHVLLTNLAASPELVKIIVTSQPRGTIPASLWHTSYVVFLDELLR